MSVQEKRRPVQEEQMSGQVQERSRTRKAAPFLALAAILAVVVAVVASSGGGDGSAIDASTFLRRATLHVSRKSATLNTGASRRGRKRTWCISTGGLF